MSQMDNPVATPDPTAAQLFNGPHKSLTSRDPIPSSSPAFGTPAYPIIPRPTRLAQPFVAPAYTTTTSTTTTPTVLPILLPPQTLRPIAFRILTKKHNLTLTSSALQILATYIGKHCGTGWREEGLAERILDEVAKSWKRNGGGVIVENSTDRKLTILLKSLEQCITGGRLDIGKLSRTNSGIGGVLSRQNSADIRPNGGVSREDSQTSLSISGLEVEHDVGEDDESVLSKQDARAYLKIISAFHQPRLMYSMSKRSLETIMTPASLFPPPSHKAAFFRNRYNLVHQRLLRNESFQTPSFSTTRNGSSSLLPGGNIAQQAYKITAVANLLGRSGTSHLLLGLLATAPTGDLALTDMTGSIVLDLSSTRPVPEDGAWFCPGMIVLVEGTYEEDGSSSNLGGAGGIGGMIGGRFIGASMGGPPAEKRDFTLGISKGNGVSQTSVGAGFGWIDFLGVGSDKALGNQMRGVQRRILSRGDVDHDAYLARTKIAVLGECQLDNPRVLEAVRGILTSYGAGGSVADLPLSIIFMGNFVSVASMAGSAASGGSIEYKEHFDALASVLSGFPNLLSSTTLVFVPGDHDPWPSSFSAGAATAIPREGVPEIFTSRVRRAVATANTDAGKKDAESAGEAIWASNPARMTLFGPVEELVLLRDDVTGRLRRHSVTFSRLDDDEVEDIHMNGDEPPRNNESELRISVDIDEAVHEAESRLPTTTAPSTIDTDTHTARKLVKTILDQGNLSPFPLSTRPIHWDYASALNLYPLPTALVLADAEAPPFAVTYEGCHVMNPSRIIDELGGRKGVAKWIEYDVRTHRAAVRDVRF